MIHGNWATDSMPKRYMRNQRELALRFLRNTARRLREAPPGLEEDPQGSDDSATSSSDGASDPEGRPAKIPRISLPLPSPPTGSPAEDQVAAPAPPREPHAASVVASAPRVWWPYGAERSLRYVPAASLLARRPLRCHVASAVVPGQSHCGHLALADCKVVAKGSPLWAVKICSCCATAPATWAAFPHP